MLGMFNSVKPYVVPKPKVDVPRPDNAVFRLHYKASLNSDLPTYIGDISLSAQTTFWQHS